VKPIWVEKFFHDGRGPELQGVHWLHNGVVLRALDYFNPGDVHEPGSLRQVIIHRPQVVMITPEEVINYGSATEALAKHTPAAMFDLGASDWLKSFSQRHLEACRHYQLFFYDELFDVIAEGLECKVASEAAAG
jgi:hypothetical protein